MVTSTLPCFDRINWGLLENRIIEKQNLQSTNLKAITDFDWNPYVIEDILGFYNYL